MSPWIKPFYLYVLVKHGIWISKFYLKSKHPVVPVFIILGSRLLFDKFRLVSSSKWRKRETFNCQYWRRYVCDLSITLDKEISVTWPEVVLHLTLSQSQHSVPLPLISFQVGRRSCGFELYDWIKENLMSSKALFSSSMQAPCVGRNIRIAIVIENHQPLKAHRSILVAMVLIVKLVALWRLKWCLISRGYRLLNRWSNLVYS